jgi:hypothetical protein
VLKGLFGPAPLTFAGTHYRVEALDGLPTPAGGSPAVLAGSVDQCVEALQGSRERFGTSYVNVGGDVEAAAPIARRLGGS